MKKLTFLLLTLATTLTLNAQVAINTDNSLPDSSAILDVKSTTKGFLPPRMTNAQMEAMSSPAEGLMIYNIDFKNIFFYTGSNWIKLNNNDGIAGDSINYEGQTYQTVVIGDQIWMAENLNVGTMISGSNNQNNSGSIEKYCYGDLTANCDTNGGLYQWAEMVQYVNGATNTTSWSSEPTGNVQGICPPGWHIPTDAEWKTLEMHLGMTPAEADHYDWRGTHNEGGKLKETGITHWDSPNTGATNSSGFTASPGGGRFSSGSFNGLGRGGYWWSSSEVAGAGAWFRFLGYNNGQVHRDGYDKTDGMSVRCLKN